ncbi:geranylgeranyl diphosphate synthase type I [Microbacterium terrae]|uniref:Hexaprenyl-diphosphate synthase large subunit ((2E,6E)-farnesyl-diphosphate specific) n=1 Tax=Microbacterium terrae TaxID=69369 RepID=A0A0M2HB07_9MICO|nr:polyprenyl synthetase family protein [Microbacterium terrae]KJL41358.1 Hexaprenyl-diphosphate synthase large subunit ((2E,6E)-farnesyl-diphosphate specific) [Microbacterium terrae]MBP1077603.1 geranylgeranyl diphosphate synthase type I [Microbacterium terrae]GLJ99208.1 geranylgeranyl pyrophosphate synthase [Microbacterium terrae]
MSPAVDPVRVISQRVDEFVDAQRLLTDSYGAEAALIVEAAAASLAGGKRLRGQFCIAGWRAVEEASVRTSAPPPAVVAAAASLEVFQAAALVHDDLIDNSDTRRGRPAAHRALEAAHRDAGWVGDADAFGRSGAVLLGDLLVAWSDDLFEEAVAGAPDRAAAARGEYATMRREVTIGQFLDIAEESAFRSAPDDEHAARALRVASLKSARYSVQQPLAIGAALAGADAAQAAALRDFGHPLGMAFQLRDDVLGVFGDQAQTGKPAGDDLREGKRTVLVAYTREALAPPARRLVDELVGDPDLNAQQIAALQQTIVDSGALDRVEALIADYARDADRALSGARLGNAAVGELRDLAHAATVRST